MEIWARARRLRVEGSEDVLHTLVLAEAIESSTTQVRETEKKMKNKDCGNEVSNEGHFLSSKKQYRRWKSNGVGRSTAQRSEHWSLRVEAGKQKQERNHGLFEGGPGRTWRDWS